MTDHKGRTSGPGDQLSGGKTLAEPAQQYDVHPNLMTQWRARLLEGAVDVFGPSRFPRSRRST